MKKWQENRNYRKIRDDKGEVVDHIITVDGIDVSVPEDVFSAYARMDRRERYLSEDVPAGGQQLSLEQMAEDGVLPDYVGEEMSPSAEDCCLRQEMSSMLLAALLSLEDRDRQLIIALFYNCEDTTDASGQITVPGTTGTTNEDGDATVGWEDEDGDRWTLTVTVEDHETGRPIEDAEVSIGKGGNITVILPDGTDMDEDNRITVTVTDNERDPQEGVTVIVKGDLGQSERGETDEDGKLTVPAVTETEYHGAYIYGYTDGTFGPERSMSRSEAAAIFARLLSDKLDERLPCGNKVKFKDVDPDCPST